MKRATLFISEAVDFSEMIPAIATIRLDDLHLREQCQSMMTGTTDLLLKPE